MGVVVVVVLKLVVGKCVVPKIPCECDGCPYPWSADVDGISSVASAGPDSLVEVWVV